MRSVVRRWKIGGGMGCPCDFAKEADVMVVERRPGSATPDVKAALLKMDPKRMIEGLDVGCRWRARMLVMGLALMGFGRARVTAGRRSLDEERRLYGKGRTEAECKRVEVPAEYAESKAAVVTWTRPERSKHVKGKAVDIDFSMYVLDGIDVVDAIVDALDVRWGGKWKVKDCGHFEV